MKIRFCWRTNKPEMMLSEDEWQQIRSLSEGTQANTMALQNEGLSKHQAAIILHKKMVDAYNKLTNGNLPYEDWHLIQYFQLNQYGPDCNKCGFPLRSPRAKLCANCGEFYSFSDVE